MARAYKLTRGLGKPTLAVLMGYKDLGGNGILEQQVTQTQSPENWMSDEDLPDPEDNTETAIEARRALGNDLSGLNGRELILAINKMNPGQKRVLAAKGNAAVRKILLRDPNFEIQLAVVSSAKTTESEVEQLAGLASTAEIVLKTIATDGRWMKSYRIKHRLATHPKTPMALATRCLRALTAHDLKKIAADPNVRKSVVQAAQQMVQTRR